MTELTTPGWLFVIAPALVAIVLFIYALVAFRRRSVFGGLVRILFGLLLLSLAAVSALISLGAQGYRALTAEQTAATVDIETLGPQRYRATFTFPDGEQRGFDLNGDELYVDARVLKWHPAITLMGMKTAYELDRVSGRYTTLDDEMTQPRTVFSLADEERPVDLFELTRDYPVLKQLVDAEYGSGTFVPVEDEVTYEVKVSTTGLLVREIEGP